MVLQLNQSSSGTSAGVKKKPKQPELLKKKKVIKKDDLKTPQRVQSMDKTQKKKFTANSSKFLKSTTPQPVEQEVPDIEDDGHNKNA